MARSLTDKTLYILDQGAVISKKHDLLLITLQDQELMQIPIKSVGALVLLGPIQITTQAILACGQSDIPISFHTQQGHFRSYCFPSSSKNVFLRMKVYDLSKDHDFCLKFSKKTVASKIKNGIELLQRYHLSNRSHFKFLNKRQMEKVLQKIEDTTSIESLLGLEGHGADLYFQNFKNALTDPNLFNGRKYFPSPDPINATLSFGYSMLAREIQALLMGHGFDPYVGFYHKLKYGRASLALDLVEGYRHIVIDRLILRLFNKNIFDSEDFEYKEDQGCYLKKENFKRFIEHYENDLNEKKHWYQGKFKSFREIIRSNIDLFKRSINSNDVTYQSYIYEKKAL